jgi:DMATS type aromatic prenyltransferase
VRMLAEAQGDGTAMSNWAAAWQLTEQLGRFYNVSLARAHKIADLFEPTAAVSSFSLWHAACIRPGRAPALKLYFNPLARGEALGEETMREAFARLGQSDSFEWLQEHALLRGHKDRFVYFSLDLGDHGEVRTKVYIAHYNATPAEVERVMAAAPSHVAGDATEFCDAMVGGSYETFDLRPLLTCFAFVSGRREPTTVTLHIPIRCYAQNDQDVVERVGSFLSPSEASLHTRAVRSIASRPLDARSGLQTYTSFRRVDGRKRLTIYLSPELYSA